MKLSEGQSKLVGWAFILVAFISSYHYYFIHITNGTNPLELLFVIVVEFSFGILILYRIYLK